MINILSYSTKLIKKENRCRHIIPPRVKWCIRRGDGRVGYSTLFSNSIKKKKKWNKKILAKLLVSKLAYVNTATSAASRRFHSNRATGKTDSEHPAPGVTRRRTQAWLAETYVETLLLTSPAFPSECFRLCFHACHCWHCRRKRWETAIAVSRVHLVWVAWAFSSLFHKKMGLFSPSDMVIDMHHPCKLSQLFCD